MGRIRTKLVKRNSTILVERYRDKFTKDFDDNKVALKELAEIPSKKLRNVVAGYVTRLMKREQKI